MKFIRAIFFVVAALWCALARADGVKQQPCVGYASIDSVGVIHLNLISSEPTHGGAMLILDKKHPLYEEMRRHIGKIKAGRWKCLKSMPEVVRADEPVKGSEVTVPRQ
jgi:hypothetical protein